jgi:acyl-CoA thioesterase FadM
MDTTSLSQLLEEGGVTLEKDGLTLRVRAQWIVKNEDRLSYTSLVRLVECCREHHWQIDMQSKVSGTQLDSICRTLSGEFIKPIMAGELISIVYKVAGVRSRGYSLKFLVKSIKEQMLCAEFELGLVFYDPAKNKSIAPPKVIIDYLKSSSEKL